MSIREIRDRKSFVAEETCGQRFRRDQGTGDEGNLVRAFLKSGLTEPHFQGGILQIRGHRVEL